MIVALLVVAYLLLLIPERSGQEAAMQSSPATKQAFAWNQDAYWKALEAKYAELRQTGCRGVEADVRVRFNDLEKLLARINGQELAHDAPEFNEAELRMFEVAPLVSACNTGLADYLQLASDAACSCETAVGALGHEERRCTEHPVPAVVWFPGRC